MFSLSTSKQSNVRTFNFDPSRGLDFENDIKILRRSRLTKLSEFMTMLLAVERFQRDAKLSSLTRKDKNQLAQQAEDAQFFRILLRMMLEVSRESGIKQRDDLKKVYHWYQVNKEVLHCEPHFKGAGKQLYKRPELKFSADAIKYYSDPPGKRLQKRVGFQTSLSQQNTPRGQGSSELDELRIDNSRPTTAPPSLNRPKIHNSLRSHRSDDYANDDASFAVNYINAYLNGANSPMATGLHRPSSAMGVIRQAQISAQQGKEEEGVGDEEDDHSVKSLELSLSSESNASLMSPGGNDAGPVEENVEEDEQEEGDDDGKVGDDDKEEDGADGEETQEKIGVGLFKRPPPISSLVNPVAQVTFDETYQGGQSPEMSDSSLLKIQVDMPNMPANQQRSSQHAEEHKAANLMKWNEYQEDQLRSASEELMRDQSGDRVVTTEVPERFTQQVIANYAAQESFVTDNAPDMPANSLASQSLEQFYKMTTDYEPKVKQNHISPRSASRQQKSQVFVEPKKVTIFDERTESNPRLPSGRGERPATVVAGAVVKLADHVGDQMMVEREPYGPELPAGFRRPSSKISPKRPSTAPNRQPPNTQPASGHPLSIATAYGGMTPPPNSSRVDSTPEYTPRNQMGEPIFALPEQSDYNVHFRRNIQTPVSPTIPHSISSQRSMVAPGTTRYKWRDDGHGNMTYRKIHRIHSAPPTRTSMRTAGSTRGGNRPKTASDPSKNKYHSCRACEANIRVPQAASHRSTTMHPATIASMVTIKSLGGDKRRTSARMGHKQAGAYPWEEESGTTSAPPNMQYMSISTPAHIKVRRATDGSKAPNQSTESLMPKDSLRSQSRESSYPSPIPAQGWVMGESSTGEPTTVDGGASSHQGGDNSSTMMAPSERSFGSMSDVDLADLTDQTLSPEDTPRTTGSIDHGVIGQEGAPDGIDDLIATAPPVEQEPLNGEDGHAQAEAGTNESDRVGSSSVENLPGSETGDTPRSAGDVSSPNRGEDDTSSGDATPRVEGEKGENKDQEVVEQSPAGDVETQLECGDSEGITQGPGLDGAGAEDGVDVQSETESEKVLPSSQHTFRAKAVDSSPSSSSPSMHAAPPSDSHSFVPVETYEKNHPHHHHHHHHDNSNSPHHTSTSQHQDPLTPRAKVVSLELDVQHGVPGSKQAHVRSQNNTPTAYMRLLSEHRDLLTHEAEPQRHAQHPRDVPEYLLMMPAVSSKPLTPRTSPQNSRPATPRSGGGASPRLSPSPTPCPRLSRSSSPSLRTASRTPSPRSVGGHLSPNIGASPGGSRAGSRTPSPSPSPPTRPKSARSKAASSRQGSASSRRDTDFSMKGESVAVGDADASGQGSPGLMSESRLTITSEDAEVSAITDNYDDLGIIDDDGAGTSICTPDSELDFSRSGDATGFSSGAASPSITITTAPSTDHPALLEVPGRRPSSAPGQRTGVGPAPRLGLPTDTGGSVRPASARRARPSVRSPSPRLSVSPSRPTSPRPTSPRFSRPVSPSGRQKGAMWEGRPVPEFGHSNPGAEYEYYQKQQEAKSSVDIQKLFNKTSSRDTKKRLSKAEKARQEKREREAFATERAYLEHLWKREIALYKRDDVTFKNWEKEYMLDKLNKEKLRQAKRNMMLQEQAAEHRRQMALLKRIGPSVDIHELFNAQTRGVSKAEMKRAAVSIQRFVRGMIVRRMLAKVKEKSRIHAGSFKSFIKYYYTLMKKIARWHGVGKPKIHLDLWEMDEFMDKKKFYEYVFAKRIHPETEMEAKDLPAYFKECDHFPSKKEINNSILGATKKDFNKPNLMLKEREVSEIVFMIYVPRGSGLQPKEVRKSTWLNPLVDGEEARKMLGTDAVKDIQLQKSLELVFNSMQERKEQKMWEEKIRRKKEAEEKEKAEQEGKLQEGDNKENGSQNEKVTS
ncbi:uncharacterized protein [Diadema antillarum]|uniref:uncharacterized protein n=1 Tax=Diadema antillarum TaxID=105358 RepID=UPI003A891E49